MKLIYIETIDSGHRLQHPAFVLRLLQKDQGLLDELHFILPLSFKKRYWEYFEVEHNSNRNVWFTFLDIKEINSLGPVDSIFLRPLRELLMVRKYARINKLDCVYLDSLNRFFIVHFFLAFSRLKVNGIYYAPHTRIRSGARGPVNKLWCSVCLLRKKLQVFFLLRNPAAKRIFILNDQCSVDELNGQYRTNKFKYLVDPIWVSNAIDDAKNESAGQVKNFCDGIGKRRNFLIFGAITRNKGIPEFLSGLSLLPLASQQKVRLSIIGKISENYREQLNHTIEKFTLNSPAIEINLNDKFVSAEAMESYFQGCDVVVNANIRTQSASGIMGHAAVRGKPSISPDSGLYGELARAYQLGPIVDPHNPREIAEACESILNGEIKNFNPAQAKKYASERHWREFADTVISAV